MFLASSPNAGKYKYKCRYIKCKVCVEKKIPICPSQVPTIFTPPPPYSAFFLKRAKIGAHCKGGVRYLFFFFFVDTIFTFGRAAGGGTSVELWKWQLCSTPPPLDLSIRYFNKLSLLCGLCISIRNLILAKMKISPSVGTRVPLVWSIFIFPQRRRGV